MMRKYPVRFGERSRETRSSRGEKVRSAPTRLSPILSNILLSKLDRFVETELLPKYTRGMMRKRNQEYNRLIKRAYKLHKKKDRRRLPKNSKSRLKNFPRLTPRTRTFDDSSTSGMQMISPSPSLLCIIKSQVLLTPFETHPYFSCRIYHFRHTVGTVFH
jgi:hypothetical protein